RTSRAPTAPARRHVSAADRREVYAREAGRCADTDDRGRRCPETGGLELHHREAHAVGGPDGVDNMSFGALVTICWRRSRTLVEGTWTACAARHRRPAPARTDLAAVLLELSR